MKKYLQQPSVASLDEGGCASKDALYSKKYNQHMQAQHKPVPVGVEESSPSMHFIVAVFAFIPAPTPRPEGTEYMDDYYLPCLGNKHAR